MSRAVIVRCATDMIPTILLKMPTGVMATAFKPDDNKECVFLRIEGDALPEWCNVKDGDVIKSGLFLLDGMGSVHVIPTEQKQEFKMWAQKQFTSMN